MIYPISYQRDTYPYMGPLAISPGVNAVNKVAGVSAVNAKNPLNLDKIQASECLSCKNRKYVDGSDENVSFKSPTHISPQNSFAAVASHEQEHVINAISEGSKDGNSLISASVRLKMDVCPDCGTPYVSGGVTTVQMKYTESNPYEVNRKSIEGSLLKGMYVNYVA